MLFISCSITRTALASNNSKRIGHTTSRQLQIAGQLNCWLSKWFAFLLTLHANLTYDPSWRFQQLKNRRQEDPLLRFRSSRGKNFRRCNGDRGQRQLLSRFCQAWLALGEIYPSFCSEWSWKQLSTFIKHRCNLSSRATWIADGRFTCNNWR